MKLNVNFENVPDEVLPIPAGIYTCTILTTPEIQPTVNGNGQKLVVDLQINDDESDQNGRRLTDNISLKNQTRIKRLAKSAGLSPGADGLDLEELEGAVVTVKVTNRTYTDKSSGELKESYNVSDYLFED